MATDHGVPECETVHDVARVYNIPIATVVWRYAKGLRGRDMVIAPDPVMLCGKSITQWAKMFAADGYKIDRTALQNRYIYHSRLRKDPITDKEFLILVVKKALPHKLDDLKAYLHAY